MAYSYSAIKEYKNCPRKYYETRILKKWKQAKTPQILYGEEVHKALEDSVKDGKPLGPHERFQGISDAIVAVPGTKITEFRMAVDNDLQPCDFFDSDVYMRGVADVLAISENEETIHVADYKTGKANYPDVSQLELMALMGFQHYPKAKVAKGALLFIVHDKVVTAEYKKSDAKKLWAGWINDTQNIELATERGVFNENPSGLCGWCPVKTCPHNRER